MSNTDRNKRTGGGSIYKMTEREYNSASAMDRYPIARGVELGQILDSINLQPKFMRNDLRAALHTKELRAVEVR